ncbi:MAG: phosphatidate cytidylyltransferase [Saccharofermentanales bacterium]|jgi:phosphatidate cytidylyltransferase|nr:phosphatidate cytidylyltransferase [Bacillota bacterium]
MRFSNQNTGGLRRPIDQETAEVPQYVPLRRKQPQNLRIRVVTAVIFIFVMAAFLIPALWVPWIALFLFAVIAVIGGSEFSAAMRMAGFPHKPWIVSLCSLIAIILPLLKIGFGKKEYLVWSTGFPGIAIVLPYLLVWLMVVLVLIIPLLKRGAEAMSGALISAMGILYISYPLVSAVVILYTLPAGWYWLLTAFAVPWISDTTAYFVGSIVGTHKILPHISPNKTLEGALGGIIGPVIAMMIWLPLVLSQQSIRIIAPKTGVLLAYAVLFGLVLGLFSQLGDLFASALKRWVGVKDFGHILPGHGGVLDRFDSTFFTLPLTLLLGILYFGV